MGFNSVFKGLTFTVTNIIVRVVATEEKEVINVYRENFLMCTSSFSLLSSMETQD